MLTITNFFKLLSDETRLRCLVLLQAQMELCVCELTEALDLSQPKISRHLAQLRQIGLLLDRRKGQWVYYRINPDLPTWALKILDESVSATSHNELFIQDQARLNAMTSRPDTKTCC